MFTLVIGFTYSDDIVEFSAEMTGVPFPGWRWMIVTVDLALVAGTALLKWFMTAPPRAVRSFLRELVIGRWGVGAAVVIVIHLILAFIGTPGQTWAVANSAPLTLLSNLVFVIALSMLLLAAFDAGASARGWIIPVAFGTATAQFASAMWYPFIETARGCGGISAGYFEAMVNVLPVFLVTLGLEVNYLRSRYGAPDPGHRAVAVLTVILLCGAEVLAFSMLVKRDAPHCGSVAVWHEYISFLATVHAAGISLATLAWWLLASPREER